MNEFAPKTPDTAVPEPIQATIGLKIDKLWPEPSGIADTKGDGKGISEASPATESPKPPPPRWKYNYPEPIYEKHRPMVQANVDPHEIQHIGSKGRQKGCQCHECKVLRGEAFEFTESKSVSDLVTPVVDTLLTELLSEEIIAEILDSPRSIAAFFAEVKNLPKPVQQALLPVEKNLKMYGKWGKLLADQYLHLPEFKHKALIVFTVWYGYVHTMMFAKARLAYELANLKKDSKQLELVKPTK